MKSNFSNGLTPLLDKAVKTYYNGQMIVKVPLSSGGGDLYFSKTDRLEVQFIRKLPTDGIARNPFSGVYEFIDMDTYEYRRITFKNGIKAASISTAKRSQGSIQSNSMRSTSWLTSLIDCILRYIISVPSSDGLCWVLGGNGNTGEGRSDGGSNGGSGDSSFDWGNWFVVNNPPIYPPSGPSDPWNPNYGGGVSGNNQISFDYYSGDGFMQDDDDENTFDPNATPDPVELLPETITLHTGKIVTISFGVTQSDGENSRKEVSKRMIAALKQTLELASVYVNISSIHIAASTNGQHATTSNHYKGLALDISRINGVPIIISGANENVIRLQQAFEVVPNRRENYGPALSLKLGQPKPVPGHDNHIHFAINAQ